jgi:hypothetical protein
MPKTIIQEWQNHSLVKKLSGKMLETEKAKKE